MTDAPRPVRASYSEQDMQRILARAAELEAKGIYTAADVRQIADEAGIDARALDVAMAEAVADDVPVLRRAGRAWSPTAAAILAVLGVGLGILAIGIDGKVPEPFSMLGIFGPSAALTYFRAMRHRKSGDLPGFLRDAVALFGGFTLATVGLEGLQALAISVSWGTFCTALGTALVSALHSRREELTGG